MRKIMLLFFVCFFVFTSCNILNDDSSSASSTLGDKLLLDLPSSLNNSSRSSYPRADSSAVKQHVAGLYDPVRNAYNPMAQSVIDIAGVFIESVDINILQNPDIMDLLDSSGSFATSDASEAWLITKASGSESYEINSWKYNSGAWIKVLYMTMNIDSGDYNGSLVIAEETSDSIRPMYKIDYDTNDSLVGHMVVLTAVNLDKEEDNISKIVNIPKTLWLKANEKDGVFNVDGHIHYEKADLEDSGTDAQDIDFKERYMTYLNGGTAVTVEADGMLDTDVPGSYVYRAKADVSDNRGAVALSIVPASVSSKADIFTNYSLGATYKQTISEWITNCPADIDEESAGIQTLLEAVNYFYDGSDLTSASSDDDVFSALESIRNSVDDTSDIDNLLFAVLLDNPAYYTAGGFTGTESLDKPSWASTFDFSADITYSPDEMTSMTISMGGPAEP